LASALFLTFPSTVIFSLVSGLIQISWSPFPLAMEMPAGFAQFSANSSREVRHLQAQINRF
jgi:hypothetical protein